MKKNKTPVTRLLWILLLLFATSLVLWPLIKPGLFISDDGEWMVIRLSAFFQSFREGQFPVRFLGRLNHSYGYPVANFLYPGFLYLGSFIHALGVPFVDTVKVILATSVIGASIFIFLWLNIQFSLLSSFVGTLGFIFAPYLIFDLYHRGSVGEVFALLPASMAMYSLAANKRWLFSVAIAILILAHNTLAMLFVSFFVLFIVWRGTYEFLLPLVLGLGMSGFFWLPALFERRFVVFDATVISRASEYFISGKNVLLLGIANIVAWVLLIAKRDRMKRPGKKFFLVVFAIATILATQLAQSLWSWQTLTRLVQFPYRFLAVSIVIAPWIIASIFGGAQKRFQWALFFLFAIIWAFSLRSLFGAISYSSKPEGYYTTNEATTTVADEYMPAWVKQKPTNRPPGKLEFVTGGGTIEAKMITTQTMNVTILARADSVVQINTIYYPGWGVTLDALPMTIDYENPQGVMRIPVAAGTHNMRAEFRETPARLASDMISIASFVVFVVLAYRQRRRYT